MRPSVKQLQYLVAVADHLHFGAAARACHVTQPALSEQLRQLEDLLGARLVERGTRRIALTDVGERIVARARAVLRGVDDLVAVAHGAREPFALPLKLGVIPTIAPYWLPRALPKIRAAFPRLQPYLREEQTPVLLELLADGKLDILLLALPVEGDSLVTRSLFAEDFLLLAPRSRKIVSLPIRQRDLRGESLLLLEQGHCLRDQALEVCHSHGATENQAFRASSLGTLVQMVANGLGMTLIPRMALPVELKGQRTLRASEFAPPRPRREIGLAWRAASPRRAELEQLAAAIAQAES